LISNKHMGHFPSYRTFIEPSPPPASVDMARRPSKGLLDLNPGPRLPIVLVENALLGADIPVK